MKNFKRCFRSAGLPTTLILILVLLPYRVPAAADRSLTIGLQDNTQSLDPAKASEITSDAIIAQLYDRLLSLESEDPSQPAPALAESWEVAEDRKTWTFHLRKGLVFSSGNPIDADAVLFSLKRSLKLQGLQVWRLTQFGITEESLMKVDDHTMQIVLAQQYSPGLLFSSLSHPVASILDPAVVMAHQQDGDMGSAWLDFNSAGSGRFILQERKEGEVTTLNVNPHYWGKPPSVNTVIIKNIQEPIEQAISLEKGDIDVAWDLQPGQENLLEANPHIAIYGTPTLKVAYMVMNLAHAPLEKSAVRDAIRYLVDYDGIAYYIMDGMVNTIQTFIPKGISGHTSQTPYIQDPEKAKQLLQKAGYADGFEVELLCYNYSPWTDIAFQIKRDLSTAGINITVKSVPDDQLWEAVDAKSFKLFLADWEFSDLDPAPCAKAFAYSDSLDDDAEVKLLPWVSQYHNPEVTALIDQAGQEIDPEAREELYKRVGEIILDDGPYAILFSPLKQYAVRLDAQDFLGVSSLLRSGLPTIR